MKTQKIQYSSKLHVRNRYLFNAKQQTDKILGFHSFLEEGAAHRSSYVSDNSVKMLHKHNDFN